MTADTAQMRPTLATPVNLWMVTGKRRAVSGAGGFLGVGETAGICVCVGE